MPALDGSGTWGAFMKIGFTKGQAEVLLLDQNKQPLLQLSGQNPTQSIHLDGQTNRYYLQWKFQHASGRCELHW